MARKRSFHTGEFARIVGVNKRTLHYYDAQGIFRPARVEPNGYRSYSFQQFYPFYMLRHFRAMGLDLAEIKEYMEHRSPARLDALLTEQQAWLTGELARLQHQMRIVRNQRALLAQAAHVTCGRVEEVVLPAAHLVISRNVRKLALQGDSPTLERAMTEHLRYVFEHKADAGYGMGFMLSPEEYLTPGGRTSRATTSPSPSGRCAPSSVPTASSAPRGATSSPISPATMRTPRAPTRSCATTCARITCAPRAIPMRRASSRR